MFQLAVGEVVYSPARDVVYLLPSLLYNVAQRLEEPAAGFPAINDHIAKHSISDEELATAFSAYAKFVQLATSYDGDFTAALREAGWNDVRPEVQLVLFTYMGAFLTGIYYRGVKEAYSDDKEPSSGEALVTAGTLFLLYARKPAWQKWLIRRVRWVKNMLFRVKVFDLSPKQKHRS